MHVVLSSAAAAVVLLGGLALFLLNRSGPESVQVTATDSPGKRGEVAVPPPPKPEATQREGLPPFKADVAAAQVIVVATALDSTPAPAKKPGDLPEVLIRFQVKRVLKGKLDDKVISTRTPTAAAEFIGKDWVILLSPDYMAGKHQLAGHINVKLEPTVKSYLPKAREEGKEKGQLPREEPGKPGGRRADEKSVEARRAVLLTPDRALLLDKQGKVVELEAGEVMVIEPNTGIIIPVLKKDRAASPLLRGGR